MCHEPVEKKSETRLAAFVSWRSAAYLVLALTIGLAYGNSLKNSFVYDDHLQIVQNPNIKSLSGLRTYFQAPHKVVGPYEDVENYPYRPVFWVSLALDYFIWGVRPFGYHLTNVALHMLNAFLVFTLLLASLQARVLSFVTALLWALHPVHTEVVNSPSTRVVLLYALFYLLSLIFFLRGTDQARCNQLPWLVGGFIAFPLSLLSYEMAVTLPAIALLLDAARAKRSGTPIGASIRRNVPVHLVFLLSLIAYLVLRYLALPVSAPRGAGFAQGLWPRLLRVPSILTADLSLLAFPRSLSIHRSVSIPHPHSIFELDVLGSVLSIVLIALALGRLAKHCDGPLWGVAWFLLIESSVLNLVPIYRVAAERFLYLPSVGFLIAIVFAAGNLIDRLKSSRPQVKWSWYAAYLCSAIAILYALRVIVRNHDWRDDVSLFRATVVASPTSLLAHLNLGDAYIKAGQLGLAEHTFLQAIDLKPDSPAAHYGLGLVYQGQGRLDLALAEWRRALQLNPRYIKAHVGLGTIYLQQGKYSQGIAELEVAVKIAPSLAEPHYNLGVGYLMAGRPDQAVIALQRAAAVDPSNAAVHHLLGLALQEAGRPDLAATSFQRAQTLDPTSAGIRRQFKRR